MRIVSIREKRATLKRHEAQVEVGGITAMPALHPIPHNIEYKADFPDIDIDFIPEAREPIKAFAAEKYGADCVCNVGTYVFYQPKAALHDAARALGMGVREAERLTKNLPLEFNYLKPEQGREEYPEVDVFARAFPEVFEMAYKMVGRIKTRGKHAGGVIISSVPLKDHMPLFMNDGQWCSAWTEGQGSDQLSKFGFIKFDLLGVVTQAYIYECLKNIKANRDIDIEWDIDIEEDRAGWECLPDGQRNKIPFSDSKTQEEASAGHTDSVFQFTSDLAKSIISKGGITSIHDYTVYTALGRPGPLPMIDHYIARRDGQEDWDDTDADINKALGSTYGVIVYQEQLTEMWQNKAGMSGPEAQAALAVVRKKKLEKLPQVQKRWMRGAMAKGMAQSDAERWWENQRTFGSYAFNKSHSVSYINTSFRCMWLKTHYPGEWWAGVLTHCNREKIPGFMAVARREAKMRGFDAEHMLGTFSAVGDEVIPSLHIIKGVGHKAADALQAHHPGRPFESLEDFLEVYKDASEVNKTIIEALIKMGAFDRVPGCSNRKATWAWWQYKHGGDADSKTFRRLIKWSLAWPEEYIHNVRKDMARQYFLDHPNRKKMPPKIKNWIPKNRHEAVDLVLKDPESLPAYRDARYKMASKIEATREEVNALVGADYSLEEMLVIERDYLGFWWSNPMDMFKTTDDDATIHEAKKQESGHYVECIVLSTRVKETTNGDPFITMKVTDGFEEALIQVWSSEIAINNEAFFQKGAGLKVFVIWQEKYQSFNLKGIAVPLEKACT